MGGDDAPLIAGNIHGIRVWQVGIVDGSAELRGHGNEAWAAGGAPTVARCLAGDARSRIRPLHRPPVGDCSCGLYGLHPHTSHGGAFGSRLSGGAAGDSFPHQAVGIVEAWGRVELHEDGFRAQYARPHTLALIGAPRESDIGGMITRLADRYGAEVVELEHTEQLIDHCSERDLGLAPAVVRSLVPGEPSEAPAGASAPPRTRHAPALLEHVVTVAMVIVALLWYGVLGTIGVYVAVGIISAIVESPPAEFSKQHLRVVDQALVELDGKLRYVAVVRNTSEKRAALSVFPHGSVTDSTGERVVRLGARGRIEARPSLLPGATGMVVEILPGRRKAELPDRLRYEVEIRARRAPAGKSADGPLELSRLSFDRERCRLAVTTDASRPLGGAGIGIVARDGDGAISAGGTFIPRRMPAGSSRQVIFEGRKDPCQAWWRETEVYPFVLPSQLAREMRGA